MSSSTFLLTATDGTPVSVRRWLPDQHDSPRAVVLIAHGMAEHGARYEHLAQRLTGDGYAVYAPDHRGHGYTVSGRGEHGTLGHLGDQRGFASVVDDLLTLTERIQADHPGVPIVLLGHSMGSFLARAYAARYGDHLAALVLSGTAGDPGTMGFVGLRLATLESRLRGPRATSHLMSALTLGPYHRAFGRPRTHSDWLSRDEDQVDAYEADPLSGATASAGFYRDLLTGLRWVSQESTAAGMPKDLPVYLVVGEVDPVGGAAAAQEVGDLFRGVGMRDLTTQVWPGARHEVFNETNRAEVEDHLLAWLDPRFPRP